MTFSQSQRNGREMIDRRTGAEAIIADLSRDYGVVSRPSLVVRGRSNRL